MKRFVKFMLMSLVVISTCSCGVSMVAPLSGEWVIEEVNGTKTIGEATPFIGFNVEDSTIYGNNSCNSFFGSIIYNEKNSSEISFSNVGSTRMLCANSPMEDQIQSAINNVVSFSYTDNGGAQLLDVDSVVLLLLSPKKKSNR